MINLASFVQSLSDASAKSEDGIATGSASSRLDRFAKMVSIIANIAVIIVAFLAYQQYSDANDDLKRSRSLSFVEEWTSKGYATAYGELSTFVEERRIQGDTFPDALDPEASALAKYNLGAKWSAEIKYQSTERYRRLAKNLDLIIQFFSRMSTCEAAALCDRTVLMSYFDSELLTFWDYFVAYATLRQESGYRGYGSKVAALVSVFQADTHSHSQASGQ